MNERIKKLAEKCVNNTSGCYGFPIIQFDENKFAELIVEECIRAIENTGGDTQDYYKDAIKEHLY